MFWTFIGISFSTSDNGTKLFNKWQTVSIHENDPILHQILNRIKLYISKNKDSDFFTYFWCFFIVVLFIVLIIEIITII